MKHALKTYLSGFTAARALFKPVLFIYASNLILGLTVVLPLVGRLQAGFGQSMLPESLGEGFDYTALTEFLRQTPGLVAGLVSQAWWVMVLFLVLIVFFSGGILVVLKRRENLGVRDVLAGGCDFFFRFFKLFVYMGVLHLLAALVVYLPLMMILKGLAKTVESESSLFFVGLTGVLVHLVLLALLLAVSAYAKIHLVREDSRRVLGAVRRSLGFIFHRLGAVLPLMILFGLTALLAGGIYWMLSGFLTGSSTFILLLFAVQQAYLLVRIWIRVWAYASQSQLVALFTPDHEEQTAYGWV
jgi:hypothetical protein